MMLYSRLFSWIVSKINETLSSGGVDDSEMNSISILDIYGFESFEKNGFEVSLEDDVF